MKKISIIVPFHNGLSYIDDCLKSIMEQNLESDSYEVLCMGDAPEEGIVSYIEKYEQAGMPVRYIQWFENRGVGYARNRGVELAEGEYIYFLDCDDYMKAGCLKKLLECAENNNVSLVRGEIVETDDNNDLGDYTENEIIKCDKKGSDAQLTALFETEITILNMLIKKQVIVDGNIEFSDGIYYFSDIDYVMQLLGKVDEYYLASDAVLIKRKTDEGSRLHAISKADCDTADKMMKDFMYVYKKSMAEKNISPKRKNILSGIFCENVIKILKAGIKLDNKTAYEMSVYLRDAVKNVPNRYPLVEKEALLFFAGRKYKTAEKMIHFEGRYLKGIMRNIAKKLVIALYRVMYLFLQPRKKVVVFSSALGRSYAGNPKAIYEKMVEMGLDKTHKCIWFYDSKLHDIPGRHKQVRFKSLKYLFYMSIAGIWIFDARQPVFIRKSNRTTYLQTWHGTPLKKLGLDMNSVYMSGEDDIKKYHESFRKNAATWDMLIAQNDFSAETFRRAFDFKGTMLNIGYPRNDKLFADNSQDSVKLIKEKLGLPADKKIMLYAPTWRDDNIAGAGIYHFSCGIDIDMMKKEFGEDYVLVLKYHYLVKDNTDWSEYGDFVYVSDESVDIADLYLVSDILITDYSSVMFDYSLLDRPMYFYCHDIKKYKNVLRGFYFDFEQTAPGPISVTMEQLISDIKNEEHKNYSDRYTEFKEKYNPWDDGQASLKVIKTLFEER